MSPYFDLEELRQVEGFENARFADPYAGGKGNSVRYMSVGVRDGYMRACGLSNLLLGGEKSGFLSVIRKPYPQVHWRGTTAP